MNEHPKEESAFSRSLKDTASAFKTLKGYFFVLLIDVAIAIAILLTRTSVYGSNGLEVPLRFAVIVTIVSLLGGSIVGLVLIFFYNALLAPYRQRNESRAFSDQILKAIEVSKSTVPRTQVEPFVGEGMAQLRITNLGSTTIRCQGEMRVISPEPSKPALLPYAIKWKGENRLSVSPPLVEIIGGGSQVLEVAQHTSSSKASRTAEMYLYRADGFDRRFKVSTQFNEPVLCEIVILCEPRLGDIKVQTFSILDDGEKGIVDFSRVI